MLLMILKMSAVTLLYVLLTICLWRWTHGKRLTGFQKIAVGLIYGMCSILSTHFGIDYGHMLLNVRDVGPLAAGLFFDPVSGIIAGVIGGVERYIAGTYFDVGSYTRIACSVSTCLAGFVAAIMNIGLFKGKKPSAFYGFFMGAVMEVFHMYAVFITHRNDMKMALYVVKICAAPMIVFTGIGIALSSIAMKALSHELKKPFPHSKREDTPVSHRFQVWLFFVTLVVLAANFLFADFLQTQKARQDARGLLNQVAQGAIATYEEAMDKGDDLESVLHTLANTRFGETGSIDVVLRTGKVLSGKHAGQQLAKATRALENMEEEEGIFIQNVFGAEYIGRVDTIDENLSLLTLYPTAEAYADRDAQMYETGLGDILLFTVIYVLITLLVQHIVVENMIMVNRSLSRITNGDLNEVVNVRESSEFASLSDDINQTVEVLKGYIAAAEKRFEQELELARSIQEAALPKNFTFQRKDFEIFATMDPAKEVGGDFYDFFFVNKDMLAMVIADVSGKGIPAALFMMRAKTAVRGMAEAGRSPEEIAHHVNKVLCQENDVEMFVTAWISVMNLATGMMCCVNAGHEYPAIMRSGGEYELFKDKHGAALGVMEGLRYRQYDLQLNPGDKLFVYTDGIPEAINEKDEQYGPARMLQILNRTRDLPMQEVLPIVRKDISDFAGKAEQFDDITMLGFCYTGEAE